MSGLPIIPSGGGVSGSSFSALSAIMNVDNISGTLTTLKRVLAVNSTLSLTSASNSNLSLSGSSISAAAPIGYGNSEIVYVRENTSSGLAIEYPITFKVGYGPPVPPTISMAYVGDGVLTINWTDGGNGGSPITNRYVAIGTVSGTEGLLEAVSLVNGQATVTGLINGLKYYITAYAQTNYGYSLTSNEISGTPSPAVLDFSEPGNSMVFEL